MLNAIDKANEKDGLGLWFPTPSEYDANAFLSALSDNLANVIERRFIVGNRTNILLRGTRRMLYVVVGVPVIIGLIIYAIQLFSTGGRHPYSLSFITFEFPVWVQLTVGYGALALIGIYVYQLGRETLPSRRIAREATALRERIRYTASLKYGTEAGLSGGKSLTATLKRSQEKDLSERPTTIASLVFDFRNLVGQVAQLLRCPVVIGIDELDKIQDAKAVRTLLRDIKGIFEVTGVHFLVSLSEEAAAALQLGTLQAGGRNEFNSSFYTVIELPPLDSDETIELLKARGYDFTVKQSHALCVISAGNQRELIRLADASSILSARFPRESTRQIVIPALEQESSALLYEIIRDSAGEDSITQGSRARSEAWRALPRESFFSANSFTALARSAITKYWEPSWADDNWGSISEAWKRLLIRLFVSAYLIDENETPSPCDHLLYDKSMVIDLRNIMLMAGHTADIARLMLETRFGDKLLKRDNSPPADPLTGESQPGVR
jgi:hypothetical protein